MLSSLRVCGGVEDFCTQVLNYASPQCRIFVALFLGISAFELRVFSRGGHHLFFISSLGILKTTDSCVSVIVSMERVRVCLRVSRLFLHEHFGCGGGGGDAERSHAVVDGGDFAFVFDEDGKGREVLRDFQQSHGVRGVSCAEDEHEVASWCDGFHGVLSVCGCVADVVFFRALDLRESFAQRLEDLFCVV